VISGHKVRTPLLDMTREEEEWLKTRVEQLEAGVLPREKAELKPYPRQQGGDFTPGKIGI
jgi:BMFP domain-containing protein YqiC